MIKQSTEETKKMSERYKLDERNFFICKYGIFCKGSITNEDINLGCSIGDLWIEFPYVGMQVKEKNFISSNDYYYYYKPVK